MPEKLGLELIAEIEGSCLVKVAHGGSGVAVESPVCRMDPGTNPGSSCEEHPAKFGRIGMVACVGGSPLAQFA